MVVDLKKLYFDIPSPHQEFNIFIKNRYYPIKINEVLQNITTKNTFLLKSIENSSDNIYISIKDGSLWKERILSNFGEYVNGLMRLPELDFEELWDLLMYSSYDFNKLGSISLFEEKYGKELKEHLKIYVNKTNQIKPLKKGLKFFKKNVYQLGYLNYGNRKRLNENEIALLRETWDEILKMVDLLI